MLHNEAMNPLFVAAAEATEEAIINAITTADSMVGRDGNRVEALPLDVMVNLMELHRRSG